MTHPCLTCGACCASFRVDFSVYETQELGGDVPDGLAVDVTDTLRRMRGTDHSPPRCAALTGKVGTQAALRHLRMAPLALPRVRTRQSGL
jgi:Fe-S-cluster containining protein